jgi:hypothetical protein
MQCFHSGIHQSSTIFDLVQKRSLPCVVKCTRLRGSALHQWVKWMIVRGLDLAQCS